jgi:hypothetical protein
MPNAVNAKEDLGWLDDDAPTPRQDDAQGEPPATSPLQAKLRELVGRYRASFDARKARHPFYEVVEHDGSQYVAVGTFDGPSLATPGQTLNILAALPGCSTIRAAGSDSVADAAEVRDEGGRRWSVWLVRHRSGSYIRWWVSRSTGSNRVDDPKGVARIEMTSAAPWVRRVR